jgi:hypothetical protein
MKVTQSKIIKWRDQYACEGVDKSIWVVQPREHVFTKQQSKHECAGEEPSQEEQEGPQADGPRPDGLPPI